MSSTPAVSPAPPDDDAHVVTAHGGRQWTGWVLGPLALLLTLTTAPPTGLSVEGWRTAGTAMLMAIFWICESLPIPVTALLPLVLFPALGLGDTVQSAAPFANPIIYLFLGGFIIAIAMQRWNLHLRIAISLLGLLGTRPTRLIAGFLITSALISMWVSNSATTMMMLPIALSVVQLLPREARATDAGRSLASALLLSIAYGATSGGMGTLIGTPPNALLAAYVSSIYHVEIGFGQWMLLGVPVVLITVPTVYLVLTRYSFRFDSAEIPGVREMLDAERARLGRFGREEAAVAIVFALTALGWILQPWIAKAIPLVTDTTISIAGALLLFVIPIDLSRGEFVMDWASTKAVPWEVFLLFGGGLSLAANIERHGLSTYLGALARSLDAFPMLVILCIACFGILVLTELTSNTATAATFLPIAAALALSLGQNPMLFLIPTALAANCSYMLPVGTPPNAIVFGSGLVTLPQMARAGFLMNLLLVPVLIGLVMLLGPLIFDVQRDVIPAWAVTAQ